MVMGDLNTRLHAKLEGEDALGNGDKAEFRKAVTLTPKDRVQPADSATQSGELDKRNSERERLKRKLQILREDRLRGKKSGAAAVQAAACARERRFR